MDKELKAFAIIIAAMIFILITPLILNTCFPSRESPAPSPAPNPIVSPAATPKPISDEERIELAKQDIGKIETDSGGTYYKTLAFLDRQEKQLDEYMLNNCAPTIYARVTDEKGQIFSKISNQSFVYGPYILTSSAINSAFEMPEIPPAPPGMTEKEYKEAIERYKEKFPDLSTSKVEIWIEWIIPPPKTADESVGASPIIEFVEKVDIEDEIISKKLDDAGMAVFKRIKREQTSPTPMPECLYLKFGDSDKLEKGDVLLHAEHIEGLSALIKGSYTAGVDTKNSFYLQGSYPKKTLGAPIFAFRKSNQEPELVGIITGTGDPIESRGFATNINYILKLLSMAGIDLASISDRK